MWGGEADKQSLLSVGIDLGTSTTQLVFSDLTVENRAGPFAVPRMDITRRQVRYRSPVYFTPLLDSVTIDARAVRNIVAEEYDRAGIAREQVQTGAVIITGETARKENAQQVLAALSEFAGDFVVATAGPDLESVLAARGAGADERSRTQQTRVLHFDIGGGTANLAYFESGQLTALGCYEVGGRLVRYGERIEYVAPVLQDRWPEIKVGAPVEKAALEEVAAELARVLAQAAGLTPEHDLLERYHTPGAAAVRVLPPEVVTLSGGVADCVWSPPEDWRAYGDLGVLLGQAIRAAFSPMGERLVRGRETIRATVVGAGSHTTELSGSTVYAREVVFPLKNLPVAALSREEQAAPVETLAQTIAERLALYAGESAALALEGFSSPAYAQVERLTQGVARGLSARAAQGLPSVVILERDMAKTLGQALSQQLSGSLLCLDGICAHPGDYLDVGQPITGGTVFPVVVKTLAFAPGEHKEGMT